MADAPPLRAGDDTTALRAWLERDIGARVVRLEPFVHGGRSRQTWALDMRTAGGAGLDLILRREVGGGPFTGTAITLGREAAVLRAVHRAGIPTPRVYAASAESDTIVLERLPGTSEFSFPDEAARLRTVRALAEAIAALHALDLTALPLPFPAHDASADATRSNLEEFLDAYRRLCAKHAVIEDTFAWLMAHAPAAGKPVLNHGDVGPGNFMHRDGRLTGVIDWELAHPGDPMDDIAWIWFRTQVLGLGGSSADFHDAYAAASGTRIDAERVRYYALAILFRCCIVTHVRQAHDPARDDARPAELRRLLTQGFAEMTSGAGTFLPQ